jgi:hypothetical protein
MMKSKNAQLSHHFRCQARTHCLNPGDMKNLLPVVMPFFLALTLLSACASSPSVRQGHDGPISGSGAETLHIIDAHTHAHFGGGLEHTSHIPMTREQYFKEWADAGVTGAVVHTNEEGSDYVDLRAHNVVTCAGTGAKVNVKRIEAGLKSGQYGCIKVYLGYVHQWAYDRNYEPAYKLAEKYHVPVVFHTGDTYSVKGKLKFADPATIDEVAVDHPNVTFVIAHCGNPWIESAAEVAYKNPNVYLDGSAFQIGDLTQTPKEKIDALVVKPLSWIFTYVEDPTKLMFGTDWPLTNIKSYVDAFKRAIPQEHWQAVFHDNAARVFKLK